MNEVVTVESLIEQMKFGSEFILALVAVAALVLILTEIRLTCEVHRIWKDLRKLEKEKLEKELESLKKDK